ncbi:putative replication factor-A protein [Helianthus annuus]|nr:putative replication factor-A protein [Helianthus annuus]
MTKSVSPDAISVIMSNPSPDSSTVLPEIVLQILDLKPAGNRYTYVSNFLFVILHSDPMYVMCSFLLVSGRTPPIFLSDFIWDIFNRFNVNDGKRKLKAILQASLSSEVINGNIQNLGLIRVIDYTLNDIPNKNEKFLIVIKCEAVSPALEAEFKVEVKTEGAGILLKPKQEVVTKSAAQIIYEQNRK